MKTIPSGSGGIRYATADRFRPPRPAGPKDKCCRTFGAKSLQATRDGMGHPVPGPFSEGPASF